MLNMMENKKNRVWRGYFCRTDPFGKMQVTKSVQKARLSPENGRIRKQTKA